MKLLNKYQNIIKFAIAILLFFYSYLVKLIPIMIFNIDVNTKDPTILYSLQIFSNLFLALCLFLMYRKDLVTQFKKFKNNFLPIADTAIKYWLIGLIVMAGSNILIKTFTPLEIADNEQQIQNIISAVPIIAFTLTTILAPFTEEVIFRKSFKDVLIKKIPFILVSGLVFGSLHVISSVNTLYDYLYIIPYSALGIAFATIYYKTDNIFASIFVHMLHNGVITLISIIGSGMILL